MSSGCFLRARTELVFYALFLILKSQLLVESSKQAFFRKNKHTYLANYIIATKLANTELECGLHCLRHGSCTSANYKISGIGKGRCELNNKMMQESSDDGEEISAEYNHLYIIRTARKFYRSYSCCIGSFRCVYDCDYKTRRFRAKLVVVCLRHQA